VKEKLPTLFEKIRDRHRRCSREDGNALLISDRQ